MFTSLQRFAQHRGPLTLLLGVACIAGSFSFGMFTSASVRPTTLVTAGSTTMDGDLNGNGSLEVEDVQILLEIIQGYRTMSAGDLIADFDGDGHLTNDDAIRALRMIASQ